MENLSYDDAVVLALVAILVYLHPADDAAVPVGCPNLAFRPVLCKGEALELPAHRFNVVVVFGQEVYNVVHVILCS